MPGALMQPTIVEGDTKSFRDPQMIYEKLSVLVNTDLPAFNKLLTDKKIAGVVVPEIR